MTISSGTTLAFTAHLDDNSHITLEMEFEASDALPRGRSNNLPVVTRRTSRNVVTVENGGTVALAGLTANLGGQDAQATKEVVILVTAQVVDGGNTPAAAVGVNNHSPSPMPLRARYEPDGISPKPLTLARQYADGRIHALAEEIARLEVDLIRARQTMVESHPQITAIENHIEALNTRVDEIRQSFEQEPLMLARQEYVNSDSRLRALSEEIARREVDLIRARQTMSEGHRQVAAIRNHIEALKNRSDEIRRELQQEFDGLFAESTGKAAVEIGTRMLSVSDDFMEALEFGLPIKGVTSPEDVNALHEIGRQVFEAGQVVLDDAQLGLLIKAVQAREDAKSLASPKVTVLVGESAQIAIRKCLEYVAGYVEPNDASDPPVPDVKEIMTGLEMKLTARIAAEDRIELDAGLTLTSIDGYEERTYGNALRYGVPKIDRIEFPMNDLAIPDGQTILVAGPRARRPLGRDDAVEPPAPLLILLTVRRTVIEDREESLSMPVPGSLPGGMGGMGGLGRFGANGPNGYGNEGVNPGEPRPTPSRD